MKRRFRQYIVRTETVNFSRTSRIHFSYKLGHSNHLANGGKEPKNPPFPFSHMDPIYYTHAVADPTHSPQ